MERFVEGALRRWLARRRRKPLVLRGVRQVRLVNEGGIAEQHVGQQLATLGAGEAAPELHYWLRHARAGNAEVDYVTSRGDWIIPVEVKADRSGSLKSLLQYAHEKRPPIAVRFDTNPPSLQTVRHAIFIIDARPPHLPIVAPVPAPALPCAAGGSGSGRFARHAA